jgi:putative transposase
MQASPNPHYRHRFPAEIISHAVWLYHVFSLTFRDVELILAERGVIVSYETIRRWCLKFGQSFAQNLRRRLPRPGDKWYLDEVFIRINGTLHYLWRAVDQQGVVLDVLVQKRRDGKAAHAAVEGLAIRATRDRKSYGVAKRALLPNVEHRQSRYLNIRAENSHRPTRRRERQMQRFKSQKQAQDFLSAHAFIHGHFHPRRHHMSATKYRRARTQAFKVWTQETCVPKVA